MWWARRAWEVDFYPWSVLVYGALWFQKCSPCTWCHRSVVRRGIQISRKSSRSDKSSGSSTGSRGPENETSGDMFESKRSTYLCAYIDPFGFSRLYKIIYQCKYGVIFICFVPQGLDVIYIYRYISTQPRNWWLARNMVGDKLPKLFGEMPCAAWHPIANAILGEMPYMYRKLSKGKAC